MKRALSALLLCLPMLVWSQNAEKDPAVAQMERLAQSGIQQALKVVQESGGFYPFALLLDRNEKVRLVGYSGKTSQRPMADDFTVSLFLQIRQTVRADDRHIAAVVLRPFIVQSEEGKSVPGVWAAVDHRDHRPWVMFQPLIEVEPGRYVLGDMVYQPSEEAIFLPQGELPAKGKTGKK